jgi:competence transcription factor ComK
MSNFIELTDMDNCVISINKYHITSFTPLPNTNYCYIKFNNNSTVIVKNSYKQIKEKLNGKE